MRFQPAHIRPRRRRIKLSGSALAAKAGINRRTLWRIETLRTTSGRPSRRTAIERIRVALEQAEAERDSRFDFRRARRLAGLTLDELAAVAGVSASAVWSCERDRRNTLPINVARIKGALEASECYTPEEAKSLREAARMTQGGAGYQSRGC